MSKPDFNTLQVGDELPPLKKAPITRTTLALFGGASNDHNPIHIDIDFAKAAGMPDVFAHGMLSMAYLGQLLTNWAPQSAIRSYGVKFASITQLQEVITCRGKVVEKLEKDGEKLVRLELTAASEKDVKLAGEALVAVA
ncbi:MAG: MaoC family dehydratase [Panacagrimonas sp.]